MDKLSGLDPMLAQAEPFEINDKLYQFRRLNMEDTSDIINILKSAFVWGHKQARLLLDNFKVSFSDEGGEELSPEQLSMALAPLLGLTEVKDPLLNFFQGSIMDVTDPANPVKCDVRDPITFPMGSEITILLNFACHPDLGSFFTTLRNTKTNPALPKVKNMLKTFFKSKDSGKIA